jgi:aminopeptidase
MENKLSEYAKLIVRVGVNVQKGQTLVVRCPVEAAAFARLIAGEAYEAGAHEVVVRWGDDKLTRMTFLKASEEVFDEIPAWSKTFYYEYSGKKAAMVAIAANDPENLKGVDPERLRRSDIAAGRELKEYYDQQMRNEFPWCVVSVPTHAWAAKVFPGAEAEEAVAKLWDAIFAAVRVRGDGGAVGRWGEHIANLQKRVKILNDYDFAKLVYKNNLGTDLVVELPEKHAWVCCGEKARTGFTFMANMPTEEIFTLPKRTGVNGVICSSLPMSIDGNLVRDIRFTVKDGRIVEAAASEGQETLRKKLDVDEGSRYFGEVALVPHNSPISQMEILFYNTLFDENASCHFAFGKAYPAFRDAETAAPEELEGRGANDSVIHEDFMIGTPDLSITGVKANGEKVPVFVEGNFAF